MYLLGEMPDAGLTDEEVEAMLSGAAQEDAEDRARDHARWRREQAEMEELQDEVDEMVEGVRGVVDADILRNRRLAEDEARRRQEAAIRERERLRLQTSPFPQDGNLVNVAGRLMQLIEGGQLWEHINEPNVQLRVTQAEGDTVFVAPVGISAHVGLPRLFMLHREVFTDHFQHVPPSRQRWLPAGDMDYAVDRLTELSNEHLKDKEPEDDGIERRTVWERLMDEDEEDEGLD